MTGYESKRAAAQDKLDDDDTQVYQDHDDALTIAYQSGYYDGKKAAQPAQEPMAWITPDGEGFRIRFSPPINDVPLGWQALYAAPPQPAQEPIKQVLDAEFNRGYKEGVRDAYAKSPQRPWVDLTDEEIGELIIGTLSADTNPAQTRPRDIQFARSVLAAFKEKNT